MTATRNLLKQMHWSTELKDVRGLQIPGVQWGFTGVKDPRDPSVHHVKQVHGVHIVEANASTSPDTHKRQEADGIFSTRRGTPVGVKTADCLPILVLHENLVMGVHAGWRGLTAGILKSAVQQAASSGIEPGQLKIAIGPAISLASFEVGEEVIAAMQAGPHPLTEIGLACCVMKGQSDRWHFDLQTAAALVLTQFSIAPTNIFVLRECTRLSANRWHSYRRDREKMGRNWAWAALA